MIKERINILRTIIKSYGLDGYIVPKNDEYFSEYAFPDRLKTISNFSGSAGFAIILLKKNYLFVDGRYTTQSKIESGKHFKILEIPKYLPHNLFKDLKNKINIGFDPNIFTNASLRRYFGNTSNLVPITENLIDKIFLEKKNNANLKNYFYNIDSKIAGETVNSKIKRLTAILKKNKIDNMFISAPENAAWLMNLRGKDVPNSPIPNCRLLVTKQKKIFLFCNLKKIRNIKFLKIYKKLEFKKYSDFFSTIRKLKGKNFSIDKLTCSIFFEGLISSAFKITNYEDPCYYLKSIKNKDEIENMKKAHILDGIALTKFLFWAKNIKIKKLTEIDIIKKLEIFRRKNKNYLYPSFDTIAGSGPNSAIIHYRANKKSNRFLKEKDILLCDSGGQYKYGTTDVTRTICFSKPKEKIKNIFTRVLKGHIAVALTNLNQINKGSLIDKKARHWLNKINLDYGHGTGHGVGFFLNVHEGPQSISKYNNVELKKGMILSNEPGYYKENKFGIRIENLVYVESKKKNLFFKNLTFAPIDNDLINFNLLNQLEKNYLFKYHFETYLKISKFLNLKERRWLQNLI